MTESKNITGTSVDSQSNDNINYLFGVFIDCRYIIAMFTLSVLFISVIYTHFSTPVYRANVLIQVEKNKGDDLVSSFSDVFQQQDDVKDDAELAILQSRSVIGKTVSDLNLDINVQEKKTPIIGGLISKLMGGSGGISVEILSVPESMLDIPFELTVISASKYKVTTSFGDHFFGRFDETLRKGDFSLLVKSAIPPVKKTYFITKKSPINAINDVLSNIDIVSTSRDTGVLRVRYKGTNREQVQATLNNIASHYLQQNIKHKAEQVDKGLVFLTILMPKKKNELDKAEDKLNQYRRENKSLNLTLEAQQLLSQGIMLDTQLNALTIQETDISRGFTKEYPVYKALLEKKKTILDEREKINIGISNMPKTQQQLIRLSRDVTVGQAAYIELLKKEQELKVSRAAIIGDVRVLDFAEIETQPIKPMGKVIVFTSTFISFLLALLLVLLKSILYKRIEKIEDLSNLGIGIYATIPFSVEQQKIINKRIKKSSEGFEASHILSEINPTALAVEAIRNLRTSLHFAMIDAPNNILMISGASPGVGKSFVSINLANLMVKSGSKVLLIDADMRKGCLHEIFGVKGDSNKGLSSLLQSKSDDVLSHVYHDDMTGLDYIPRGRIVSNPSELLMQHHFQVFISKISKNYDLVIIDTPPVLAVTDSAIVGRLAGTSMLVVGFAKNSVNEIETSLLRFEKVGIKTNGLIVNGYIKKAVDYYSSDYNYGYKY